MLTFPILQSNVDEIVTVSDEAIREACQFYLARMKQVVEPSGAVSLAALLAGKIDHQAALLCSSPAVGMLTLRQLGSWCEW